MGEPRRGWWRRSVGGSDAPGPAFGSSGSGGGIEDGIEGGIEDGIAPFAAGLRDAAASRGWPVQEQDASLSAVLEQAPLRLTREYLAAPVTRGYAGSWELVAFDVVYRMPKGQLTAPLYAVTAVPVPIPLPALRVSPRRFLTRGGTGLLVLPTGDDAFEARWRVLVETDTPQVRGVVTEPLRAALLAGPDIDELWTAGGHLAASRADGHHDQLLTEHSALLTAAMAGLQRSL
ncbi:MAG: hypothetical protein ACR2KN_02555 [Geodermatophilaceae bacterium]